MKIFRNIALVVLIIAVIAIVTVCSTYNYMISPISEKEVLVEVEIPANSSIKTIAKILKEKELIRNEDFFLLYVKIFETSVLEGFYV